MSSIYGSRFWQKSYHWRTSLEQIYPQTPAYYVLRDHSMFYPDKAATWFYGAEITYDDLYLKCTRLANVLVEHGIKKGDRVGLLMPNCPQFVISYWAVLMTGAIVVNLNPLYTTDELRYLFGDSGLTGLIAYDATIPIIKPLCKEFDVPTVIVTKLSDFMPIGKVSTPEELGLEPGWLHFSQVLDTTEWFAPPDVDIQADDPAVLQYTGGTTGVPKGAVLTQLNITATAMTLYQWTADKTERTPVENRRVLSTIPFFHVYGESCCIIWGTFANATMVILPRFDVNEVFDTINKFDTFLYWPAVPTMIQALFYNPRVKEINWHRKFAYAGSGAAPASEELIKTCRKHDFNFYEGFGMSETGAIGISTPTCKPKPMSIGIPMPDVDIRLVNDEGNDVPLGETGEIWLKSPHVMKEYWNKPEDTANSLTSDGWLRTGDVAYMDKDGYIFIVDRTKDMIITGGFNVYPREVDDVLIKHPKVADAMTIGIPDEYRGETIKAFVQLKPDQQVTEEELTAYCREHLTPYKVPRAMEFRSELPRTNTGKALRRVLREEEMKKMEK